MNICAIDQSFTNTALIIFDYNSEKIIDCFVLKTSLKIGDRVFSPEERIFSLNTTIQEKIEEYQCPYVFLEGLSLNSNSRTMRDLAGLYYVIKSTLYGKGIECKDIPPKSVKAFALHGNAKKNEMFDNIPEEDKNILIDTKTKKTTGLYDLSDAYWIGKFGIKFLKSNE